MWDYRATLVRVIDGDTVVLLMDTGFNGGQEEPERTEPGGLEATAFTIQWMHELDDVRWPLRVHTVPTTDEVHERCTLVRYLATVDDAIKVRNLNADLAGYLRSHPEWGTGM